METTLTSEIANELVEFSAINKKLLSEITFIEAEIMFLKALLEKNFTAQLHDHHVNRINLANKKLNDLKQTKSCIKEEIALHQSNLDASIANENGKSIYFLRLEHERFEARVRDLNHEFSVLKAEILNATSIHKATLEN